MRLRNHKAYRLRKSEARKAGVEGYLPEKKRPPEHWRRRRYGITPEQYAALLAKQDGKCAICQEAKPLHVDHCHTTKKVRGLLCFGCNTGLGKFQDDPGLLTRAIAYITS